MLGNFVILGNSKDGEERKRQLEEVERKRLRENEK